MFESARLKLTAWYLLIIMAISVSFSAFIYIGVTREVNRIIRTQRFRIEHPELRFHLTQQDLFFRSSTDDAPNLSDLDLIQEARTRVLVALAGINVIILVLSSCAGYFLAGRTLRPIKDMVDEQNRFIADASHELNTPLTSLRTLIEVNLRNKKITLPETKTVLSQNLEQVNNLAALSGELIELAQYQKSNGLSFEPVSLDQIIKNAIEKITPLAEKKHIILSVHISDITISGNPRSLVELFVILLDNAIKYSPEKKSVVIHAKKADSKIEVTVTDNGIGIEKEDIAHIFQRFYRADKSRTKKYNTGYGLGLSIAKRIITLHNGTISVVSKPNKSTTFTLIFPVA